MTSKLIYFTVGGFPEQAEFSNDDTLQDVRGDSLISNVIMVINNAAEVKPSTRNALNVVSRKLV